MVGILTSLTLLKIMRTTAAIFAFLVYAAGIAGVVRAETALASGGNTASVRINFVIIIPESISLAIKPMERMAMPRQSVTRSAEQSGFAPSVKTTSVSAMGTFTGDGTMTLTVQESIPDSSHSKEQRSHSANTSFSGSGNAIQGWHNGATLIDSGKNPVLHTYSSHHVRPHHLTRSAKETIYTLSAP